MNNWILLTAFRHLRSKRREKGDTSTVLSIVGILSGVMTMITVIGVMNGFQGSNIEKKVEIGSSHITIESLVDDENFNHETILESVDGIEAIYKSSEFITAVTDNRDGDITGIQVLSIPENIMDIDSGFSEKVVVKSGEFDLSGTNSIVVGQTFAYLNRVRVGGTVSLLSLKSEDGSSKFRPDAVEFRVTGIYRSGSVEYDETLFFISNKSAENYFSSDDQFYYRIKVGNRNRASSIVETIENIPGFTDNYLVKSWRDYNTSYYNALKNEKDLMTVLIGLIFLVVGVNIYNSIRRSVYLRFEEISVLKTMGATSNQIRIIFILESFIIGFTGATIGVVFGLWITGNINLIFQVLEFIVNTFLSLFSDESVSFYGAQYFYISSVPVKVYFSESLMVFISAVITSVTAAYFASHRISVIRPGEVIRNE